MYVKRNIHGHSHTHCCCGKAVNVTYSECVSVASVIQHAKYMQCIMTSVACLVLTYFSTISHFLFSLQLWSVTFLILRRILQGAIIIVPRSSRSTSYSCQILTKFLFS